MSAHRYAWEDSELSLLSQVYSEMRTAKLHQIFVAFNKRNHQSRSKHAVRAKLRKLDLPVERGDDEFMKDQSFSMRYSWIMPELGIFIPLHPLIAEARRHAARALSPGHPNDVPVTTKWLVIADEVDISRLRCAEEDRAALKNYLNYIQQ